MTVGASDGGVGAGLTAERSSESAAGEGSSSGAASAPPAACAATPSARRCAPPRRAWKRSRRRASPPRRRRSVSGRRLRRASSPSRRPCGRARAPTRPPPAARRATSAASAGHVSADPERPEQNLADEVTDHSARASGHAPGSSKQETSPHHASRKRPAPSPRTRAVADRLSDDHQPADHRCRENQQDAADAEEKPEQPREVRADGAADVFGDRVDRIDNGSADDRCGCN